MLNSEIQSKPGRLKLFVNLTFGVLFLYCAMREGQLRKQSSSFDLFLVNLVGPTQEFLTSTQANISNKIDLYFESVNAKEELKESQKAVSKLNSRVFELEQVVDQLEEKLELKKKYGTLSDNSILAEVIALDSSSGQRMVRVNKGLNDGVHVQSPVVTHQGLIGFVYRVSNNFSDVLTILDSKTKIDVAINRTNSQGILEGNLKDVSIIKYVRRRDPVVLEDLVITSGVGNIYPKGIPVGKVSKIVRHSHGISQEIEVRPEVNFNKLSQVVVLSRKYSDLDIREMDELSRE